MLQLKSRNWSHLRDNDETLEVKDYPAVGEMSVKPDATSVDRRVYSASRV